MSRIKALDQQEKKSRQIRIRIKTYRIGIIWTSKNWSIAVFILIFIRNFRFPHTHKNPKYLKTVQNVFATLVSAQTNDLEEECIDFKEFAMIFSFDADVLKVLAHHLNDTRRPHDIAIFW